MKSLAYMPFFLMIRRENSYRMWFPSSGPQVLAPSPGMSFPDGESGIVSAGNRRALRVHRFTPYLFGYIGGQFAQVYKRVPVVVGIAGQLFNNRLLEALRMQTPSPTNDRFCIPELIAFTLTLRLALLAMSKGLPTPPEWQASAMTITRFALI